MLVALCEHLFEKPVEDLDGMVLFICDEFGQFLIRWSIRRALSSADWTSKAIQRIIKGRNTDIRDYYGHLVSEFPSWSRIYVDESGCNKRINSRRRGWSPRGVTPAKIAQFQRSQRYQILPAYDQDDVARVQRFQGSTDAAFFLEFMKQLLPHCNPFPGKRSAIILDNASFHHRLNIEHAYVCAGVKLVFPPPCPPDRDPIDEFPAELKAFIRKHWTVSEANPDFDFESFLAWCVDQVGGRKGSARGHFRTVGVTDEELEED